jgi:hypothetical protein
VLSLALEGVARSMPGAADEAVRLRFLALVYGGDLAAEVSASLAPRRR